MTKISTTYNNFKTWLANIPFKTYVTVMLEGIGLFANLIAITAFFGATNTPKESENFYINNQEFLVWSLIAGVYTLGLLSARFKRRWRAKLGDIDEEPFDNDMRVLFFRGWVHWWMFIRDFCFTLVITFPISYLYIRALDTAVTDGNTLPWVTLGETALAAIPVTFGIMIASAIFDKALSLYSGD